jgi:hypothetical protein
LFYLVLFRHSFTGTVQGEEFCNRGKPFVLREEEGEGGRGGIKQVKVDNDIMIKWCVVKEHPGIDPLTNDIMSKWFNVKSIPVLTR